MPDIDDPSPQGIKASAIEGARFFDLVLMASLGYENIKGLDADTILLTLWIKIAKHLAGTNWSADELANIAYQAGGGGDRPPHAPTRNSKCPTM